MKKLTLDTFQFEALKKMVNASFSYYDIAVGEAKNIIDMSNLQLRREIIFHIAARMLKDYNKLGNGNFKQRYSLDIQFDVTEALTFLSSIIPNNTANTYADNIKQIVIDYCIEVLKENGLIPNTPTYRPAGNFAVGKPEQFTSSVTSFEDYLEH
jgi:hypothetical protein